MDTDLIRRVLDLSRRDAQLPIGLVPYSRTAPTTIDAVIYEPLVCMILQGEKRTSAGSRTAVLRPGHAIVVSHATPVVSRITRASPEEPYVALVAPLDVVELRSLYAEMAPRKVCGPAAAFAVGPCDEATAATLARYVALADDPQDAAVLGPLVRRELHYRLLQSELGSMLHQLLHGDSHASNITRAIEILRADYRDRIEVPDLAHAVGMSASAFYKHFKVVTSTTPLQFQKELRLTEAHRLLVGGDHSVSTAAYAVGYESPSQFSREYARKFGNPPSVTLAA